MMAIRKEENNSSQPHQLRDLPARSPQRTTLLQRPTQGVKAAVEHSASVYFGFCRRIATLLNRKR